MSDTAAVYVIKLEPTGEKADLVHGCPPETDSAGVMVKAD